VGSAGRADVFRWQGEEATARRDLIEAEARVRIAALEFKRVLNRPLELPLAQRPVSLSDEALLVGDTTALAWLDDPGRSLALTDFLLAEAYTLSPELTRVDALMAAQRRQYTSAGRAFWLPSLNLQGGLVNQFSSGGAGSAIQSPVPGLIPQPEDLSWQFKLQASLPLFTGFANTSTRAQTGLDLDRLGIQRQTIRQAIDQQVRASLEAATASYAAIALARDAADASLRNFALVSDAYAEGTASITALIDAQSAALTSAVSAANAVHNFLIDLMRVERAVGAFGSLQSPAEREQFRERLRTFIRERAH
jgi:outer membrane protein